MIMCCFDNCPNEGRFHITFGHIATTVATDSQYTGASYCSTEHLAADVEHLARLDRLSEGATT